MRITRLSAASGFTPPGHFDMKAFVLQASGQGGHLTLVRSVFLPGGRAEYSVSSQDSQTETIYYMLDGGLAFTTDTETVLLHPGDSILCQPGDGISVCNQTNLPATVLILLGTE